MSDPIGRTTTYLAEVQDEFGELINVLESWRLEQENLKGNQEQFNFNVALGIVIQGAKQEMENYTHNYLNEED